MSGDEHPSGGTIFKCADCGVERCDAEEVNGLQHLDSCPNCGSESVPVAAGTWSAREHPSGLRDAIAKAMNEAMGGLITWTTSDGGGVARVEAAVAAWLSVVSEDEREAAARAHFASTEFAQTMFDGARPTWDGLSEAVREAYRKDAERVLAASRGVLIPKETQ